ncbi:transposase [Sphingobacterium rhinopitheci]|uniref:transposase n=1 Tax=Sphingobacterium rhinopitheci TaxID=2781960 RepID=UPI00374DC95D|nr:transposase [Sphingobacterium rhinopitheci]
MVNILKGYESGKSTHDICRKHGITVSIYYQWEQKYGNMHAQYLKELKVLREENSRLKRMFADLILDHRI